MAIAIIYYKSLFELLKAFICSSVVKGIFHGFDLVIQGCNNIYSIL